MDVLDRRNANILSRWGADIDAMMELCRCGVVAGSGEEQTAVVHALFWKKWWAYAS